MGSAATRRFAVIASATLLWHSAGVVNAVEIDPLAHCCCGDHDPDVPCACPDCPGHGEVRWARPAPSLPSPSTSNLGSCRGRGAARDLLQTVPATALPVAAPSLSPPHRSLAPAARSSARPRDRLISAVRPPP